MIELRGLQVENFSHPQDRAAWTVVTKAPWLKKLMDWMMTKEAMYEMRTDYLGNAFEVRRADMPDLFDMVEDVCRVLDYQTMPRLFTRRSSLVGALVNSGENPILVFPDFILNNFDDDMLRFQIGRTITMLKANNAQIRTSVEWILKIINKVPGVGTVAVPVLADWVRKSRYTEDRGALLACQDEDAAMKALFRYAGLPRKYIDPKVYPEYISAYQQAGKIEGFSQSVMTAYRTEAWKNDRIVELFKWYSSGEYFDLIEDFE